MGDNDEFIDFNKHSFKKISIFYSNNKYKYNKYKYNKYNNNSNKIRNKINNYISFYFNSALPAGIMKPIFQTKSLYK